MTILTLWWHSVHYNGNIRALNNFITIDRFSNTAQRSFISKNCLLEILYILHVIIDNILRAFVGVCFIKYFSGIKRSMRVAKL